MRIRDVMTTNVISIPSNTSLLDARRIMEAHRIRRLPVADRGKLVGIVNRDALDRAGPSSLTTFSIHELSYLLSKITVKEIMAKDVVTIHPDTTVEEAVALAQEKRVGALPVMEDGRLVGIVTTNDFFYKILNPLLGIGKPGSRIVVHNVRGIPYISNVLATIEKLGIRVVTMFTIPIPNTEESELTIHLDTTDLSRVLSEIRRIGFSVEERTR